jgi:predicted phage terminase large subunit-like protein
MYQRKSTPNPEALSTSRYVKRKQTVLTSISPEEFADSVPHPWRFLPHTFASFISSGVWIPFEYLVLLSHLLTQAVAIGNGRVVVSVPPRHGKSWFISQYLPAWFLANWPDQKVILCTYEANFAASWGKKTRDVVEKCEPYFDNLTLSQDLVAASRWETSAGGGMFTAGVGGPITGKGGDLILVDDPHKNWQEAMSVATCNNIYDWFKSTLYTRAEPNATIIVLHTRWSTFDLIGRLLEDEDEDDWFSIRFPAIAEENDSLGRKVGQALCPQRYDEKALHRIEGVLGSQKWAGLYQQRPAPMKGNVFNRTWWKHYRVVPPLSYVVQSWDTGFKKTMGSAYSCCQTWGYSPVRGYVLLDRWREKVEWPELVRQAKGEYLQKKPNAVLIEDKASGQSLIQELQRNTMIPVLPVEPVADKELRARAVSPLVEAGRVWLPEPSEEHAWITDLEEDFANFPSIPYVDDIDAMSQALMYLSQFAEQSKIVGGGLQRRAVQLFDSKTGFGGFRQLINMR